MHTSWQLMNVAGRRLLFYTYSLESRRPATELERVRIPFMYFLILLNTKVLNLQEKKPVNILYKCIAK